MTRLIIAFCVLSLLSLSVAAQVKIKVLQQNKKKYETIHASIENAGSKPITFCIEVGQTSPKGDGETETTPSPFWVQGNDNGKWGTLMIGPDVGSLKSPEVLDPGKSRQQFSRPSNLRNSLSPDLSFNQLADLKNLRQYVCFRIRAEFRDVFSGERRYLNFGFYVVPGGLSFLPKYNDSN
jgi:hypothetical protein